MLVEVEHEASFLVVPDQPDATRTWGDFKSVDEFGKEHLDFFQIPYLDALRGVEDDGDISSGNARVFVCSGDVYQLSHWSFKSSQRAFWKIYLFYSPSQERATRIFPRKEVFVWSKKKSRGNEEKKSRTSPRKSRSDKF